MRKTFTGELMAEFLGTALLVLLGNGVVATAILMGAYQGQWQPSILWGLTVAGLVYIFGGVSGAHFNPAVTLTVAFFRDFPKAKILPYILAQVAGGFAGSAVLHGLISSRLTAFEASKNIVRDTAAGEATARIFSTYPGTDVSAMNAFFIEIVITMMLLMVILAITDNRQAGAPQGGLGPVVVGATVALLVGIGGPWTMAALNPARDLGPRLWMAVAGWGPTAVPGPGGYMWVPILGPIVGGILAGFVYENLVRPYLPAAAPASDKAA
ncbi:MAG: MIP/aquaporin family protein [Bacillota bacterium]